MWDLSSTTKDRTLIPCLGRQILNQWTTREVLFINKVLLKHSHAHPFMYCLWLLLLYSGRVDFGTGTIWPQSRKYFQFDPLQKRFADPLDGSSQLHL